VPEPAGSLEADPDPAGIGLSFMAPAARITAVVRRGIAYDDDPDAALGELAALVLADPLTGSPANRAERRALQRLQAKRRPSKTR